MQGHAADFGPDRFQHAGQGRMNQGGLPDRQQQNKLEGAELPFPADEPCGLGQSRQLVFLQPVVQFHESGKWRAVEQ
jgi:hypothetical protein